MDEIKKKWLHLIEHKKMLFRDKECQEKSLLDTNKKINTINKRMELILNGIEEQICKNCNFGVLIRNDGCACSYCDKWYNS
jgi:uncharacterized protein YeeX (DUF496 family)